jgi:hypothetical protein
MKINFLNVKHRQETMIRYQEGKSKVVKQNRQYNDQIPREVIKSLKQKDRQYNDQIPRGVIKSRKAGQTIQLSDTKRGNQKSRGRRIDNTMIRYEEG